MKATSGLPLPSARDISSKVIIDKDNVYDNFTLLIMQWGQFLDHDVTHTPITKGKTSCCQLMVWIPYTKALGKTSSKSLFQMLQIELFDICF